MTKRKPAGNRAGLQKHEYLQRSEKCRVTKTFVDNSFLNQQELHTMEKNYNKIFKV